MDNSGTQIVATAGELFETVEERVNQGAAIPRIVSGTRHSMDGHPGRFVDYRDVLIFIYDIEGDILGEGFQRRQLDWTENGNLLRSLEAQRRLRRLAVDLDLPFIQQLLDARAADVLETRDQE